MTTRTGLSFVVGSLLLLSTVLWFASEMRRAPTAAAPAAREHERPGEPGSAASLVEPEVPASASDASPARSDRVELATDAAAPAKPAPAAVAPDRAAHVRGRCIDGSARALADVAITGTGLDRAHRSEADGTFDLAFDLGKELRQTRVLEFARAGLGARRIEVLLRAGESHELADVVLLAACRLSGRVADARGQPLEAEVRLEEALDLASGSRFTGPQDVLASTKTRADGAFAFEDVAPGRVRVWAGRTDWLWSASEPLELAPGDRRADLELVLAPLGPEDTIDLSVIDPHGAPVPNARLLYHYDAGERTGTGDTQADENGRFRQFLDVRASYSFQASDPEDRYRPAIAWNVPPGTHDLVLQLGEKRFFRLKAEEQSGAPVKDFRATLAFARGDFTNSGPREAVDGVVELVTPPEAFGIDVDAAGFELAHLGPYEPGAVPDTLVAHLHALPGIRGRVTSAAGPVSGARVGVHQAQSPSERYVVNGFACWQERFPHAEATTDANGEYVLTLRTSGDWYVRAEAPGFAPIEVGPFTLDAATGAHDVDLRLGRGGTIAGRVIVPAGEEPSGQLVGLSCGDGFGFTGRTDANGEFRFGALTPGKWQVVWRQDEIRTNSTTTSSSSGEDPAPEIPWDCEVREGETTHFDLDLRKLRVAELTGRFRLGEAALRDWRVVLSSLDDTALDEESASLDPSGAFHLTTSAAGRFRLTFLGELGGNLAHATTEVALAFGDNRYDADVVVGAVNGRLSPALFEGAAPPHFVSDAHPGLSLSVTLQHDADGRFALEAVPAGPARIEYRTAAGADGSTEVVVPRGAAVEVRLP